LLQEIDNTAIRVIELLDAGKLRVAEPKVMDGK
jgi:hypothetical protein